MEKQYIEAKLERRGKTIEFIATDETLDRQGESIPINSWDLGNFSKNPVLLVNHDYKVQNIVGKATNIRFSDWNGKTAMVFEPMFHGITQLAREVEQMVVEGILATVSVGFLRKDSGNGTDPVNELMEISFVPVPANPSAERIKSLIDPQLSEDEIANVKAFAEVDNEVDNQKEGRILSEKNRSLIGSTLDSMKQSISALEGLLDATQPDKGGMDIPKDNDASGQGETPDTPTPSKGKAEKGRAVGRNAEVRVLQHLAKHINGALYEIKKQNNNG